MRSFSALTVTVNSASLPASAGSENSREGDVELARLAPTPPTIVLEPRGKSARAERRRGSPCRGRRDRPAPRPCPRRSMTATSPSRSRAVLDRFTELGVALADLLEQPSSTSSSLTSTWRPSARCPRSRRARIRPDLDRRGEGERAAPPRVTFSNRARRGARSALRRRALPRTASADEPRAPRPRMSAQYALLDDRPAGPCPCGSRDARPCGEFAMRRALLELVDHRGPGLDRMIRFCQRSAVQRCSFIGLLRDLLQGCA